MKKVVLSILCILCLFSLKADKGMWIPMLIGENFEQMQKLGIQLTPEDIYSVNKSSLKDAIVHFGGGCTGEMISGKGLLMTNHHCGYGSISELSTVDNNYLANGFVANTEAEELPVPGLTVKFLQRMEDVTDIVRERVGDAFGKDVNTKVREVQKELTEQYGQGGKIKVDVRSFYSGNKYYMFLYKIYTDVRLVAAPPESLGKFGGDTDNWMWPRHTCDFSMFRVYSDNNNEPAEYSKNNRPFRPKHHLPVSLKGVQDGDFAMVMGYPGSTQRYLTSYGIDLSLSEFNPSIVDIRTKRLGIMDEFMDKNPETDLAYSSQHASVANYWKYFIGQSEQLKKLKIYDEKKSEENEFMEWAMDTRKRRKNYKSLMTDYESTYSRWKPYVKQYIYYREAVGAPTVSQLAMGMLRVKSMVDKGVGNEVLGKTLERMRSRRKSMVAEMDLGMDKKLFSAMNQMFYKDVPKEHHPDVFSSEIFTRFGSDNWDQTFDKYTNYIYSKTALLDAEVFDSLCTVENIKTLLEDPAITYVASFDDNYSKNYADKLTNYRYERFDLDRAYQGALLKKNKGQLMSPDANSTMRVSYGSVKAYKPQDAVSYNHYTTADGLLEKFKPGDKEFDLPENVVQLLKDRDYGDYADANGNLVTCFISNNDITGGNSGSPVINAKGEYIGSAFDGNWEAMSGDIAYDARFKRTISVDARYIFWVLDKVLGGRPLMDEMTIRNN